MKTIIITAIIALSLGIGGTLLLHKPSIKKPTDETIMTAKFTFKDQQKFFWQIQKNAYMLANAKDTAIHQKQAAMDSIAMATSWLGNNIDSIYTNR